MKKSFWIWGWFMASALWAWSQEPDMKPTVITSQYLEMEGSDEANYFVFRDQVAVSATNLEISCDRLEVLADRTGGDPDGMGEIGTIRAITAIGNVIITQEGRTAYAGRADVDPVDGIVVLSESPRVVDNEVEVTGWKFVLERGKRTFKVIPDPNAAPGQGQRSKVSLGALPDLGFSQDDLSNAPKPALTPEEQQRAVEVPVVPESRVPAENPASEASEDGGAPAPNAQHTETVAP